MTDVLATVWPEIIRFAPPVFSDYTEFIDYQALSEWLVFDEERYRVDHSMLVMEDLMWTDHQRRLATFFATGVY